MKTTILFIAEVEINETTFIKIRFADYFKGFKQNDGEFTEEDVSEVVLYKSTALAMIFNSVPELALAYSRTESFQCIAAALQKADCELKRVLTRDEDADHDRYCTDISNIKVTPIVQKMLDKEIERAFE